MPRENQGADKFLRGGGLSFFTSDDINEFKVEAFELLGKAEESLLALDNAGSLKLHSKVILRSFHNIKGAASIIDSDELQSCMHHLESLFIQHSNEDILAKEIVELLLQGIDASRQIIKKVPSPGSCPDTRQDG